MAEENAAQSIRPANAAAFGLMQRTQLTCVLMQRAFSANDRANARDYPRPLIRASARCIRLQPLH